MSVCKQHVAEYWIKEENKVRCKLCPHCCLLSEGHTGLCKIRHCADGKLFAEGYGRISSENIDPIEKKPLKQFFPGEKIYSIGGWGCNFSCNFCQNWTISQQTPFDNATVTELNGERTYSAKDVVNRACKSDGIGIAYTYNEPLISFEFVKDCAVLAHKTGLKNVLVTNGYINRIPATELLPHIDALNIDIKCVNDNFYVEQCGAHLQPVLDFSEQAVKQGCHVEITNLIIPGLNDSDSMIESLAKWIAIKLGQDTPLHLSAYFPRYKSSVEATTLYQVMHAKEICLRHLRHVYMGNV